MLIKTTLEFFVEVVMGYLLLINLICFFAIEQNSDLVASTKEIQVSFFFYTRINNY